MENLWSPSPRKAAAGLAGSCALFCALLCGQAPAFGSIVFGTGTVGGVDNVLFDTPQLGMTLLGSVDGGSGNVTFTQPTDPEPLTVQGFGQSTIEPVDGVGFTSLRTAMTDGSFFTRFEIDPIFTDAGLTFVAVANDGTSTQFTSGSGQSRINAIATDGTLIEYIDIIGPADTITQIKQVRLGGLQPASVPEPSSWLLLAGVFGFGLVFHSARRLPGLARA